MEAGNSLSKSKISGLLPTLSVVLVASLFSVTVMEAFLWLVLPVPLEQSVLRHIAQDLPGLKGEIIYKRNAFGFRALSMNQRKKPQGTVRVFCLGASTTDQSTQNTEDTWCGILERRINEMFVVEGVKVETMAFGRGGMKAQDLLYWARRNLLQFEPDLVITLMGINDHSFNGGPTYFYGGLVDQPEEHKTRRSLWHRFKEISQIGRRISIAKNRVNNWWMFATGRAVQWHSENLPHLRHEYQDYPYVVVPGRESDPIYEFSDAMAALLMFLKESRVKTIILGQPVFWKEEMTAEEINALWFYVNTSQGRVRPSTQWLLQEITRYNNVQGELARRVGSSYLDLDQLIPKNRAHYFDDCHFTDHGSQRVASEIFPLVRKHVRIILEARIQAIERR